MRTHEGQSAFSSDDMLTAGLSEICPKVGDG